MESLSEKIASALLGWSTKSPSNRIVKGEKISSEEMEFFQTIITMSRIEVGSESLVKNIFNITNLSNEYSSLAMFAEHEEDVCYAELSECKLISTYEEITEIDMSSIC